MLAPSEFEIPDELVLARLGPTDVAQAKDVAAQVEAALTAPLEFPGLNHAVIPGDQIALTIQDDSPLQFEVLIATLNYLTQMGIAQTDLSVVTPANLFATSPTLPERLEGRSLADVNIVRHQVADDHQHAYVAATMAGLPIVFCRTLQEADFIIPIHPSDVSAGSVWSESLCPTFCDRDTQQRFKAADDGDVEEGFEPTTFAEEALQQLGVLFSIEVLPNRGTLANSIVAGEFRTARQFARELSKKDNAATLSGQVDLIVATPNLPGERKNLKTIAKCAQLLSPFTTDDGTIVVVTGDEPLEVETNTSNGDQEQHAIQQDADADRDASVSSDHQVEDNDDGEENEAILQSLSALTERIHIVLCGPDLDPNLEDFGIGLAESKRAIGRLAQRYSSCLFVEDAIRCQLSIAEVNE